MSILSSFMVILLIIGAVALIGYTIYVEIQNRKLIAQVTSPNRGEWSERRTILPLLRLGINPRAIFHDLYIQKPNGSYTQVDLAVATKSGIIVFEIKDYSGWLFGNGKQKYWTQILSYGKEKHRFYNPILQNEGHIASIRQCLPQNPNIQIYSVIVFYGNCELKDVSFDTPNTFIIYPSQISSVVQYILDQAPASYGNKYEIRDVFTKAVQNGTDPLIRQSQISSAQYYGRNKPQSSYSYFYFPRFFRRKFW